jgi:hypothetical protein
VKEYEVYVPLNYNDGRPIEPHKVEQIGLRLLDNFTGLTFFPQRNQGFWKIGKVTFRDEIVIFRVVSGRVRWARRFMRNLKEDMKRDLKQKDVLIVEKEIFVL